MTHILPTQVKSGQIRVIFWPTPVIRWPTSVISWPTKSYFESGPKGWKWTVRPVKTIEFHSFGPSSLIPLDRVLLFLETVQFHCILDFRTVYFESFGPSSLILPVSVAWTVHFDPWPSALDLTPYFNRPKFSSKRKCIYSVTKKVLRLINFRLLYWELKKEKLCMLKERVKVKCFQWPSRKRIKP